MSKNLIYICENCGGSFPKWMGKCSQCGNWNSLVETVIPTGKKKLSSKDFKKITIAEALDKISTDKFKRIPSSISEFDRVLGGKESNQGIVPGSVVLLAGDPGIGKSTLLLQVCSNLVSLGTNHKPLTTLYVSGEESSGQIKLRADRLGISSSNLLILPETNVDQIIYTIEKQKPALAIIDSIQALYSQEITSQAGTVPQVYFCSLKLTEMAKEKKIPVFLIGHVTKAGSIAGPKVLEHLVDVVLYLEGEKYHTYRMLRNIKNRFGPTSEVGIFEMKEKGFYEVKNPSKVLIEERASASGSVIAASLEGTRPLLVELQALTSTTSFGYPKRTASGIDFNRLQLLLAVLTKRAELKLANQDVYCNVSGGFKISEPALDLGICLAIASAYKDKPIDSDLVTFGEVGLSGELKTVFHSELRIIEAERLGFKKVLVPQSTRLEGSKRKIKVLKAQDLKQAIKIALSG